MSTTPDQPAATSDPGRSAASSSTVAPTAATSAAWEPDSYLRFAGQRTRPVADLIARVGTRDPARVVDLGCGPGNATALLSDHWPGARVLGVDSAGEMIDAAQRYARPGRLDFLHADLRAWSPVEAPDVIVSNAALQWVPGHLALLPRLLSLVASGGWFAFSVPGNAAEPSHTLLAELQRAERWSGSFTGAQIRPRSHEPADYLRALIDAAEATGADSEVEVWETTYYHVLEGEDGALDYARPTVLRPVLAELGGPDTAAAQAFVAEYGAALREAYPPEKLAGRTVQVMPYRRLFAVAHRTG